MTEAEWVSVGDLVPWDQNPRDNDGAVDAVAKSIERFGFASPIIVRKADSVVIAGHTRLKASIKLGLDKVLVRYMDLDPAMARALAIADNKLGELSDWSEGLGDVLRELKDELDLDGLGWSADELEEIISPQAYEAQSVGELDVSDFDNFDHKCPRCSFEWSDAS